MIWQGTLSANGRPAMIAGIAVRVRRWCLPGRRATAAGTVSAAAVRSRRQLRYPIRPARPPAIQLPAAIAAWPGDDTRSQFATLAAWQAFINSGQLAIAEWLPAGAQTAVAMARFREGMLDCPEPHSTYPTRRTRSADLISAVSTSAE